MSGSSGSNVKYTIEIKKSAEREMDRLPERSTDGSEIRFSLLRTARGQQAARSSRRERDIGFGSVTTWCCTPSMTRKAVCSFTASPTDERHIGERLALFLGRWRWGEPVGRQRLHWPARVVRGDSMGNTLTAVFDGQVLRPDSPVDL